MNNEKYRTWSTISTSHENVDIKFLHKTKPLKNDDSFLQKTGWFSTSKHEKKVRARKKKVIFSNGPQRYQFASL